MPCIMPLSIVIDCSNSNDIIIGNPVTAVWTPNPDRWFFANNFGQFVDYSNTDCSNPLVIVSPNGETVSPFGYTPAPITNCSSQTLYDNHHEFYWVVVTAPGASYYTSFTFPTTISVDLSKTQNYKSYGIVILNWNSANTDYYGVGPNGLMVTYHMGGNYNNVTCVTDGEIVVQDANSPQEIYSIGQPNNDGTFQTYWDATGTYTATAYTGNTPFAGGGWYNFHQLHNSGQTGSTLGHSTPIADHTTTKGIGFRRKYILGAAFSSPSGWSFVGAANACDAMETNDGDTSYAYSHEFGATQLCPKPNTPGCEGKMFIKQVTQTIVARKDDPSLRSVVPILKINGNIYYGNNFTLTESYQTFTYVWTNNPATGLPWTLAEINNIELGVEAT